MNYLITGLALLMTINTYAQSKKTLVRSFRADTELIQVQIPGTLTEERWASSYIKLEISISSQKPQEYLDAQVKAGFYDLTDTTFADVKHIVYKNTIKKEQVAVKVYLPSGVNLFIEPRAEPLQGSF